VSLDANSFDWDSGESKYLLEPSHGLTPERLFERQWALALLDRVLSRLRDEQIDAGKLKSFEVLQPFLSLDRESANYAEAAVALDLTESAVRVAAHRLRKRYRELLRDEISHTVVKLEDVEDELKYLFSALSLVKAPLK
jgi:RNA polymerase sigma-70 factor (ECF subfamily)